MTEAMIQRQIDLRSAETENILAKEYVKARDAIKKEMAKYYEKYAKDGILTYAEMTKYNRLNSMNVFIAEELKSLGKVLDAEVKTLVKAQYEGAYFDYGLNIDGQAKDELNWGVINRDTISALVNTPTVSGLSIVELLTKTKIDELTKMRQTITQGFVQGESYPTMARRIAKQFDRSAFDAMRIARTEGARSAGEGQAAAYDRAEDLGIELKRIWKSAVSSPRTRDAHKALNDVVANEAGEFVIPSGEYSGKKATHIGGFGVAALDINCRCRIVAEVVI